MQTSSAEFADAVESGEQTLAKPLVYVDWSMGGSTPPGTIDDLSDQIGTPIQITHKLDDGMPDEVSLVSGQGTSEMSAPLVYGNDDMSATQYFSPFNTGSPIYGYPRDGRDVTVDAGLFTENGDEYIRVFTGRTLDAPVTLSGSALVGVGNARLKLAKTVQLPALYGPRDGANATWLVTYVLYKCGIWATEPAGDYPLLWAPMYGSLMPFIATRLDSQGRQVLQRGWVGGDRFWTGPDGWSMCALAHIGADYYLEIVYEDWDMEDRTKLLTQASNGGKVQFWVFGDPAAQNPVYTAASGARTAWTVFRVQAANGGAGTTPYVRCFIDTSRNLSVTIFDGWTTQTLTHSTPLPTDYDWHRVGFAWDFSANRVWITIDGVEEVLTPGTPLLTTRLPASLITWDASYPAMRSFLTMSDVRVDWGDYTAGEVHDWYGVLPVGNTATVMISDNYLRAVAEKPPREGWAIIGDLAQAELATFREDELGHVYYLTRDYWATAEAQTPVAALDTRTNVTSLVAKLDASKIRNQVNLTYTGVTRKLKSVIWEYSETLTLPPGSVTYVYASFSDPILYVDEGGASIQNYDPATTPTVIESNATINDQDDGTGTYETNGANVAVTVEYWNPGSATVQINNTSGSTFYLVNNEDKPTISLVGDAAVFTATSVSAEDATSIAARGPRTLDVTLDYVQDRANAVVIAQKLVDLLKDPVALLDDVEIVADPRLQPGDLVTFADAENTQASGNWRVMSIEHEIGDGYKQKISVRKTTPVT